MAGRYIIALDAGTSGARCLAFDMEGNRLVGSAREWDYYTPQDAPSLAREFDPKAFWFIICQLIIETLSSGGILPKQIAAVAVTSQRQGLVFLDKDGQELYAGPNLDLRAVFEGAAIDEEMGKRIKGITGHLPSFFFALAKLRWFQLHRPKTYARIASVLTMADWIVWKLTGVLASETTLAGEAGLLDVRRRRWCKGLLENMGLDANVLVPLAEAGNIAGRLDKRATHECGLIEGTPVVLAGADTQCSLLGLGVVKEGQIGVVAGWSAPLQMVTSRPIVSGGGKTWTGCHLLGDRWVLECSPGDAGNAYAWLKGIVMDHQEDAFLAMDSLAQEVSPGSDGAMAFLGPSVMDMSNLGLRAGGIIFPVPLTFDPVTRGHLVRASLEACAYAIRANYQQLEDISGFKAEDIRVGGGMTRSRTFVRILADVLGRKILVSPEPQVSAVGAALCAAKALGHYESLGETASSRPLTPVEPDPLHVADYQEHYQRWTEVSKGLKRFHY